MTTCDEQVVLNLPDGKTETGRCGLSRGHYDRHYTIVAVTWGAGRKP